MTFVSRVSAPYWQAENANSLGEGVHSLSAFSCNCNYILSHTHARTHARTRTHTHTGCDTNDLIILTNNHRNKLNCKSINCKQEIIK